MSLVKNTLSKVSICPNTQSSVYIYILEDLGYCSVNSTRDLPDMFAFGPRGIAS